MLYSQYHTISVFTLIKHSSERTIRAQLCNDNEIQWASLKGHSQDVLEIPSKKTFVVHPHCDEEQLFDGLDLFCYDSQLGFGHVHDFSQYVCIFSLWCWRPGCVIWLKR